jgi:hypothetical protein
LLSRWRGTGRGGLPGSEEDLIAPTIVIAGGEVEDNVDEVLNVLHIGRLGVQMNQGGSLVLKHSEVQRISDDVGITTMRGGVILQFGIRVGIGIVTVGVGISFSSGGTRSSRLGVGGADACGSVVALLRGEGGLPLSGFCFGEGGLPLSGFCFGEGGVALGLEDVGTFIALGVRQHGPLGDRGIAAIIGGRRRVGHGAGQSAA